MEQEKADPRVAVKEKLEQLERLRTAAGQDAEIVASIDAKVEAAKKELDALEAEKKAVEERRKNDLRVEVADRVRSYAKEGDRFMAARSELVASLARAVEGGAIAADEAKGLRADLKISEA